ncbi:hypothetical protein [Aquimarina aggregata]|nr:hypothetical protein [Aquimarina aggregata]
MSAGQKELASIPDVIRTILIECRAKANQDAPAWKSSIEQVVDRISSKL